MYGIGRNAGSCDTLLVRRKVLTRCRFANKEGTMETNRVEELRTELSQLLRKQSEVLESRTFGGATGTELLEYEIRQEIIHDLCDRLAHSAAA
jgi:hypothetical protein